MARQRFIWPDLWTDPGFGRLAPLEQVIYIGCFSNADDDGRLQGSPAYLKTTIVPYAKVGLRVIHRARGAILVAMPQLVLYETASVEYLVFVNWRDWQKPKYPKASRLPPPPPGILPEPLAEPLPESFPEPLEKPSGNDSPVGWVGLGRTPKSPSGKPRLNGAKKHPFECPECGQTYGLNSERQLAEHLEHVHWITPLAEASSTLHHKPTREASP